MLNSKRLMAYLLTLLVSFAFIACDGDDCDETAGDAAGEEMSEEEVDDSCAEGGDAGGDPAGETPAGEVPAGGTARHNCISDMHLEKYMCMICQYMYICAHTYGMI